MHYVLSVARLCERMRKSVAIKTKRVWHAAHFCSETRSVQTSVFGCFERVLKWVASGIQYILQLTNNLYLHSTPKYVSTRTRCDRAAPERPSPFRDRFTHAHINGRVYGKIRRGKERAWDTSPESWVMYSDVIVFVVSLLPPSSSYALYLSAKSARAILTPT